MTDKTICCIVVFYVSIYLIVSITITLSIRFNIPSHPKEDMISPEHLKKTALKDLVGGQLSADLARFRNAENVGRCPYTNLCIYRNLTRIEMSLSSIYKEDWQFEDNVHYLLYCLGEYGIRAIIYVSIFYVYMLFVHDSR